ncbi:MAG: glycosyltransferase family 4 protein [Pseudomonadota bacterium]
MTPRVLSLIDTGLIAGAGKAVLQLHAQDAFADSGIANFDYGGRISSEFNDVAASQGFRLHLLKQSFALDPRPIAAVHRLMQEQRYELLETHGYKGHLIGLALSRRFGTPWVALAHGWTDENLKIRVYNALERFCLRRADAAVTVSPPLYDTVAGLRGRKGTHLIYNAIDLPDVPDLGDPPAEVSERPFTWGVIGRFSPEKAQDIALSALAALTRRAPGASVHLRLIGDGQERQALEAQSAALGLGERVSFAGWCRDMDAEYRGLDGLLLPSRSEGLPFVVLEAMSYGLPVVATDVGAISDVLSDGVTGWVVPPGDAESLAERMAGLMVDAGSAARMGEAARASLTPRFAIPERVRRFLEVYRSVLDAAERGASDRNVVS